MQAAKSLLENGDTNTMRSATEVPEFESERAYAMATLKKTEKTRKGNTKHRGELDHLGEMELGDRAGMRLGGSDEGESEGRTLRCEVEDHQCSLCVGHWYPVGFLNR